MARVFMFAATAALTALLAFAQKPPASKGTPSIGVFLDFDSVPGRVPVEVMKQEADKILRPSGVSLDWRLASENHGNEAFDGLVLVKFRGKCRVESWTPEPALTDLGQTETLGTTEVVNGHVLPFSEVRCDQVKRALAYLRPEGNQRDRQRAFGIALGRVVAHELYHALVRTTAHAARGLAQATESLDELVSAGSMGFRAEDSTAIRRSLLGR
jgi:hypothetical protein